ncbi:YccT family protein [Vibrio alginolyticus]
MMKKTTTLLGLCAMLSAPAFAAQLTLQSELVPRVLNGEFVYPAKNNSIELKDGENQLAVTVGQIVFEDGKRRKFDSQPLVLEFDAETDTELSLTYQTFRTIEEARAFELDPKVVLKDKNGKEVAFSMVQLRKGGLQGFRDYEREVADYNNAMNKESTKASIASSPAETKTIKASFNELSREEQQEFMQWAMRNLK